MPNSPVIVDNEAGDGGESSGEDLPVDAGQQALNLTEDVPKKIGELLDYNYALNLSANNDEKT